MPTRSKKPCAAPLCPELVDAGKTYCPRHQKKDTHSRNKKYNKRRDPKIARFYSSRRWRKTRNMYIRANPLCEWCQEEGRTTPADVVDHIVPIKIDFERKLNMNNLQSLCNSCHARKTQKDKQKYEELR